MTMETDAHVVFLGCNYTNAKIKKHFNQLKSKWEKEWPLRVILIDKERRKGARDLWSEIKRGIASSSLAIFDVSAFRPNVVLELGYALAIKDEDDVVISVDSRKPRQRRTAKWLLSDIGHLNRIQYKQLGQLDKLLDDVLERVPIVKRFLAFQQDVKDETNAPQKYIDCGLRVLQKLRDSGTMSDQQMASTVRGSAVRIETLRKLLKKHKLARRDKGRGGWFLVTDIN